MISTTRVFSAVALLAAGLPAIAAPAPSKTVRTESPTAAARRALDEVADYHFQGRTLTDVLADFKDRTKVNFSLDTTVMNFGVNPNMAEVNVDLKRARLRDALKAVLAPYNLRFGVTRDGVFISTEDGVTARQLRQSVTVDCDGTAFDKAVAALAAETGANVVLDPRLKDKAAAPIVLKLEDVPLETAIRLMAEVADLRAVRMNNVLFVTTKVCARDLRADADGPVPATGLTPAANQVFQGLNGVIGFGGFGGAGGIGGIAPAPAPAAPAPPPAEKEPEKKEEKKQ